MAATFNSIPNSVQLIAILRSDLWDYVAINLSGCGYKLLSFSFLQISTNCTLYFVKLRHRSQSSFSGIVSKCANHCLFGCEVQ